MAHALSTSKMTGKVEMFYTGVTPWHGLGQALPQHATKDEALDAAGLRWKVVKRPIQLANGFVIPDRVATVRADSDEYLGVVGDKYGIIQNEDLFEIAESVLEAGAAMYETAGALKGGRRVWILAKLPGTMEIVKDDVVGQYVAFMAGHDGGCAAVGQVTGVRVVCNNTLQAAFGAPHKKLGYRAANRMYVRHTSGAKVRIAEAQKVLGIAAKHFEEVGNFYKALSAKQISALELDAYINAVFPIPAGAEVSEESIERAKLIQSRIARLHEDGAGASIPGVRGTLWGAFNAVTEYVDHVRPLTEQGRLRKDGFEAALFGSGQALRQKAFDEAATLLVGAN